MPGCGPPESSSSSASSGFETPGMSTITALSRMSAGVRPGPADCAAARAYWCSSACRASRYSSGAPKRSSAAAISAIVAVRRNVR